MQQGLLGLICGTGVDTNEVMDVSISAAVLNTDESVYDLINSTSRLTDLVSQIRIGEVFDEFDA